MIDASLGNHTNIITPYLQKEKVSVSVCGLNIKRHLGFFNKAEMFKSLLVCLNGNTTALIAPVMLLKPTEDYSVNISKVVSSIAVQMRLFLPAL